MILFETIFLTSSLIALTLYLIQILMMVGCCDKHIKFQVNIFRATTIAMVIALVSFIMTFFIK